MEIKTGKILILGGGFGGIRAALDLEKRLKGVAQITLIDRNSYHLFVPALYEVAAAFNSRTDPFATSLKETIAIPYSQIFSGKKINFVQAELQGVDLERRLVMTRGGSEFSYDYLVLALGSQVADFGIPGVNEYACQFKNIDDAVMLNRKMDLFFSQAARKVKALPIKIYVAGAGFTGIELAAELAVYSKHAAKKHRIKEKAVIVYLFEALPKILPNITQKARELIAERLTKLGVVIMENSAIEQVGDGTVKLKNGQMMQGDCVVWTAGIKANPFLQSINSLNLTPRGKIIVGEHLHLPNYKNVFAVGDNIEFVDHETQKPIPALAYLAVDHGKVVARNIYSSIHEKELMVHRPFYKIWVAPVGGKFAVANLWLGITLSGRLGWMVRNLIDLRYFLSILGLKKSISLFFKEQRVFLRND